METSAASSPAPGPAIATPSADMFAANPDNDKLKRKRQPRNSACQGCAALKMKCIAASVANGKCERCNRMGRECIPAVPKPRKRRTQSNAGLDASQTSQGLPLADILDAAPSPTIHSRPLPKFDPPPALPAKRLEHHQNGAARVSLPNRSDSAQNGGRSLLSLWMQGLGNVAVCEELLHGISYNFIQTSFDVFRQLNSYFPFVDFPLGADLVSIVTHRPVLTLAICVVATINQPELQSRLNRAFRHALSSKVVLDGERSLDLLTGLLVYLAWHHHYLPQQQIYQKLCLLVGMAADLDLYKRSAQPDTWDPASALERDRAFVGCYYLSCNLSRIGFDKPNPLRWTDNLRRCAENVARAGNLPSDRALVAIVELVHVLDDLEDALRFDISVKRSSPSYHHSVDLHSKAANHRLKALKREYPSLGGTLGYGAALIHVYHRLLQTGEMSDYPTLIQCACAIKEYLDDLLARPPSTLHRLAIVDWIYLLEILVLMARVARASTTSAGWEAGALTSMLQPEALLEALYAHMSSWPANDPESPRNESLLRWFRSICDGIQTRLLPDVGGLPDADARFQATNEHSDPRPGDDLSQPEQRRIDSDTLRYLNDGVLDEALLKILTNT